MCACFCDNEVAQTPRESLLVCVSLSRQSRGIDLPAVIRRGEGAQMKWCQDLR